MDAVSLSDFDESTVDKVYRLLELLDEIERHPALRGKFVLHGGTAINLFMLGVPRLSVDIDISYIGALGREEMEAERPLMEEGLREVAAALGYRVPPSKPAHAGTTLLLNYRGPRHDDHVKIDAIYLNRLPLVEPVVRETPLAAGLRVRSLSDAELIGGKVKAFFDRVKVRDLYDVSNLHRWLGAAGGEPPLGEDLLHEVVLYSAALSARFPFGFEGREGRFAGLSRDVEAQLHPMLRRSSDRPALSDMMDDAAAFVERWVMPRGEREAEFLGRLEAGDYDPSLLFGDPGMAVRAAQSPQALWKAANLRKRKRVTEGPLRAVGRPGPRP